MQKILNKLTLALHVNPILEDFFFLCHSSCPCTTFGNFLTQRENAEKVGRESYTSCLDYFDKKCHVTLKYFQDPISEKKH